MKKNHIDDFKNSSEQDCRATDSWYNRDYTDINGEPKIATFEKEFQPKIAQYFNQEVSLLDAGSGNGRFTNFFSNQVRDITACDPYQPLLESFIKENVEYYQVKFLDFELPKHRGGKKYDIVFMNGLLYLYSMKDIHAPPGKKIHSPEKLDTAFEKTKSLLSDGGILIVVGCNDRISTLDSPAGGHYNLHKQAQRFNFELVEIYRYPKYNTHMSILKNLG